LPEAVFYLTNVEGSILNTSCVAFEINLLCRRACHELQTDRQTDRQNSSTTRQCLFQVKW